MTHKPTQEQQAIIDAATSTTDNILVSALAGAAKTSTLEMVAHALPSVNMVCLAFNKAIAVEMKKRLPSNCTSLTLNSLGHRVWGQYLGKRLTLNKGKMFEILSEIVNEYKGEESTYLFDNFAVMLKVCNEAKSSGHLPDKFVRENHKAPEPVWDDEQLFEQSDEILEPILQDVILDALNKSARQSMQGIIDFGDQVLFPSLYRCSYPIHSLILVDETQDLSALNHRMLQQLYRRRIIAVGDECQAIYGFRGAYEDGMEQMKDRFDMVELHLTTTFRCPEEIVDHVRWRAPEMKSWEGTPSGEIHHLTSWSLSDIPEGAAVICRNNAPLLRLAVNMLKHGQYPNLWGNDIAAGLIKRLTKLGPKNMKQEVALQELEKYHEKQKKKVKSKRALQDRMDCMHVLISQSPTLGEAITYANHVFSTKGQIHLMTGHKSKGHEFDNVYFLDQHLIDNEGQDPNLRYVICTRAQRRLIYVESDTCLELMPGE